MGVMEFDLAVIGGGINGAGIARDAAGRGLRVLLCEQGSLGAATSSASSKLIHGGLRYLEHGDLRLVREALHEREVLMRIAPHLVRPLQFFLPLGMPRRPGWKIRAGLKLYDWLAGATTLPRSGPLDLSGAQEGMALKPRYRRGLTYWDCWGDDTRLVVANEQDARSRGALSFLWTRCERAVPSRQGWLLKLAAFGEPHLQVWARAVVNATGPWAAQFLSACTPIRSTTRVRLVKGSHFVVDRVPGERALLLQHADGRVVFVLPFEGRFTLIGTTDVPVDDPAQPLAMSDDEASYLCDAANRYLASPVAPADVIWSFAGVRPVAIRHKSTASWRAMATMIFFLRAPLIFKALKAGSHLAIVRYCGWNLNSRHTASINRCRTRGLPWRLMQPCRRDWPEECSLGHSPV